MRRSFLFLILLFLSLPTMAQKAYEAVYYKGQTEFLSIRFTLGDGYLPACEIKTTELKTMKKSVFLPEVGAPDEHKQIKFYHFSAASKSFSDYFIIDGMEEVYDQAPAKLYGKYYFNGKVYPFTLTQK